ncbi:hypothetical protein VP496E541_P0088 [Vibrio phage 496E54-1]|nr:hypothetical protein VP495E541_P0087 [Vibrio phage 495E54-1]CAH9013394.1 hypothetical protein VP496E541_P0088 [Vibrio phage 496E54-1]
MFVKLMGIFVMCSKIKSDYDLWNEYLNTPKEVFMMKYGASFSTKDLEISKCKEPEGKIGKGTELETPYGYETKLKECTE